jgi:hypothetical protein
LNNFFKKQLSRNYLFEIKKIQGDYKQGKKLKIGGNP